MGVKRVKNDQTETPLFSGLLNYARTNPLQFHVPGHKKGKAMDPLFRQLCGKDVLSIDLTNIAALDDLHQPQGLIQDAQRLAAEAFGSDHCWFSVQGTSTPIMAMITAVCRPGEKLILPRNIHRSVLSGLIFSGAKPIFICPPYDPRLGIYHGLTPSQVGEALQQHPDAKGVFVVNPTYYGFAGDLEKIVEISHLYNVPVLVDEAHGAHCYFHPKLPLTAMEAGADLAATSVHKLGGSLTQSSLLNLQGKLISPAQIQTALNMFTTTSASFLLLASLDAARRHLALFGQSTLTKTMDFAENLRTHINEIAGLWCPGQELVNKADGVHNFDPTKLLISLLSLGISGREAELWLQRRFKLQVELSDLSNILCVVTGADNEISLSRLRIALESLSASFRSARNQKQTLHNNAHLPELALTPRQAFYAPSKFVNLEDAIGSIVAEWIMTYPPGIPLILPGEKLDLTTLDYIKKCQATGLTMLGTEDPSGSKIRIVQGS